MNENKYNTIIIAQVVVHAKRPPRHAFRKYLPSADEYCMHSMNFIQFMDGHSCHVHVHIVLTKILLLVTWNCVIYYCTFSFKFYVQNNKWKGWICWYNETSMGWCIWWRIGQGVEIEDSGIKYTFKSQLLSSLSCFIPLTPIEILLYIPSLIFIQCHALLLNVYIKQDKLWR